MWSGLTEVLLRATPKMDLVVLLSGYTPSLRQWVLYLDVNRLRDLCGDARVNRPQVDSSPCTPYKIGPRSLTICNPSLMQKIANAGKKGLRTSRLPDSGDRPSGEEVS